MCVLLLGAATLAGAVSGGNDFYTVRVEADPNSVGIGLYTVATGPAHPITLVLAPVDILFNGTVAPGQSFTTIRSYTSGTDYLQHRGVGLLASAPPTLLLHDFVAAGEEAIPLGDPNAPSGYSTIYRLAGSTTAPDPLLVVQNVEAVGSTFNSSAVKIETVITNQGSSTVELGVRYLWDYRIGSDDGPTFQEKDPDGPVRVNEDSFFSPLFDTYEIGDNNPGSSCFGNVNIPTPLFRSRGSVIGPAALAPTPPTRLDFAAWPEISGLSGKISPQVPQPDAFGYANSGQDTATCDVTYDDSAVAYWWGDDASNALIVQPGATVTIAAYIFGYLPGDPPIFEPPGVEGPFDDPSCSDGVDNDGDGLIDMDDPDCAPPNLPPDCTGAGPSIEELWPPNHKMRQVGIDGVTDPDGDPVSLTVLGIFQDEPLNGKGDGNTCPDAGGAGGERILLRAERSGQRDGRVYHIFFEADDGQGGTCSGNVSVCVPHDQGKKKAQCVDQGPVFDSTGPCQATASECLSRKPQHFGARPEGEALLSSNASAFLKLNPHDPLGAIFPEGNLLPIQLGAGAYVFSDVQAIAGTQASGAGDGGFLPWNGKTKKELKSLGLKVRNALPAQTLTLALNTGLSLLEADSGSRMDLDGDSTPEILSFRDTFPGLVVDRPGKLGDLLTVEEVLLLADRALAAGAGSAKLNEPLAGYVTVPAPGVPPPGKGKGKAGKGARVGDLIQLVSKVNSACDLPESKLKGTLRVP